MSVQIKKILSGRKRFIKTAPLKNKEEWGHELLLLRDLLTLQSNFQVVGSKVYLEVQSFDQLSLMLEVVGVPLNPDQKTLTILDQEASEVLVYEFANLDLFNLDFEALMDTAKAISKGIDAREGKLSSVFHIVFDNEKIELHFFRQKDYIQNLP